MTACHALSLSFALAIMACARGSSGETSDSGRSGTPGTDTSVVSAAPGDSDTVAAAPASPSSGADRLPGAATPTRPAAGGTGGPPAPPPSPSGAPPTAGSDTARGRVAVVGSTPITQVVLRPTAGRSITLIGPLADEIGSASGADVWVRGRRTGERSFEVASYAVRSVDGVPAVTGSLVADGSRLVLVSDDGRRHVIANPPASLREHVGARVWVSGDLATGITAYGVLRRRS